MLDKNTYSLILPTLNEAGHIKKLIQDISKKFTKNKNKFEIIVVDDNSTDGTNLIVKKIKLENLILIERINQKANLVESLKCGIKQAKYNNIIWMDADYSHPPRYINNFIKINRTKKFDLIVASRFLKNSKRYFSNDKSIPYVDVLSLILNKVCKKFLFHDFTDYTSGYICIKKKKIKEISIKGYYGDYFISLITQCKIKKMRLLEIPYEEKDRASGKSKTTSNKIDFMVKCFFYIFSVKKNYIIKLFNSFFY